MENEFQHKKPAMSRNTIFEGKLLKCTQSNTVHFPVVESCRNFSIQDTTYEYRRVNNKQGNRDFLTTYLHQLNR